MISVINKAMDIVELLALQSDRPVVLGDIARALGLNLATCANIIKTLVHRGMVEQVAPRKGYVLGPAVHYLARSGPYRRDLALPAEPAVVRLARELRETAMLVTLRGGQRFVLCESQGQQELRVNWQVAADDVFRTATGRLLAAHLPEDELQTLLERVGMPEEGWAEVRTAAQLAAALDTIRQEGCVLLYRGEVTAVAYPVRQEGRVVAALGIYMPQFRFAPRAQSVLTAVARTASEIESAIINARTTSQVR